MNLAIHRRRANFGCMNLLSLTGISKKTGPDFGLSDIHFTQQKFQKMAIAGETGSGKSTLLKIIAGLVQPDEGLVLFEGKRVRGPNEELVPGHPRIAYLSQHFELRTNYRVEEVLEYANKRTEEEAWNIYRVCRISHLLKRRTDQLSGGEKQRIALARLLTTSPGLLLLDEPYSNLDMIHKNILKQVIRDIGLQLNISCLMVSHDPTDTLSWADEIIIMKNGRIIQQGNPEDLYLHPVNEYAAGLLGSYNLLSEQDSKAFTGLVFADSPDKKLLIRPGQCRMVTDKTAANSAVVDHIAFMGSYYEVWLAVNGITLLVHTANGGLQKGDTVWLSFSDDVGWML